jgi:F0F1-type ATP synthase assembly protein I
MRQANGLMQPQKPSQNVEIARYLGLGLTWALSTALFLYLGSLADKWLGTDPALTVIGAFVGGAAGFYHLYHQLMRGTRERKQPRGKDDEGTD